MSLILFNVGWMVFNSFLALLGVGFAFLSLRFKRKYLKILFGLCWLLFIPNTIYIVTDLIHLFEQWNKLSLPFLLLLLLQYIVFEIFAILTFMVGALPLEKLIQYLPILRKKEMFAIIMFNFYIAFCLVMGRVERINSWDVVMQPIKVIESTIHVFTMFDLLGLMILYWVFCSLVYLILRKPFFKFIEYISSHAHIL